MIHDETYETLPPHPRESQELPEPQTQQPSEPFAKKNYYFPLDDKNKHKIQTSKSDTKQSSKQNQTQ